MPFRSEAQRRACWAKYREDKRQGRRPRWNCYAWEAETHRKKKKQQQHHHRNADPSSLLQTEKARADEYRKTWTAHSKRISQVKPKVDQGYRDTWAKRSKACQSGKYAGKFAGWFGGTTKADCDKWVQDCYLGPAPTYQVRTNQASDYKCMVDRQAQLQEEALKRYQERVAAQEAQLAKIKKQTFGKNATRNRYRAQAIPRRRV